MLLSTVADDKAKYKKMLVDWVVSLLLIFVLQYIIIFTVYCNNAIVNALKTMFDSGKNGISDAISSIAINGIIGAGIESMASVIVYIMIVAQTIGFLLAYMKRMIKVGFLIMISPLISITYSIDKMGDGKAQALGNWLKEYVYTILIQPFHCVMYVALVKTAFDLLVQPLSNFVNPGYILSMSSYNQLVNGVLAILCLKFVNDGEKIVRKIFGFQDDNSSTSMAAGMAMGMMALSKANNIGAKTRMGLNKTKNLYGKALSKDLGVLSKTKFGGALSKGAERISKIGEGIKTSASNKVEKISNTINKIPVVSKTKEGFKEAKKNINGFKDTSKQKYSNFKDRHKNLSKAIDFTKKHGGNLARRGFNSVKRQASLSNALGIMAAAMAYSTGDTGALQAIGMGSKVHDGVQGFVSAGASNVAKSIEGNFENYMEPYEELLSALGNNNADCDNYQRLQARYLEIQNDRQNLSKLKGSKDSEQKKDEINNKEEEIKQKEEALRADLASLAVTDKNGNTGTVGELGIADEAYALLGNSVTRNEETGELEATSFELFKNAVITSSHKKAEDGPMQREIDKELEEIKSLILQMTAGNKSVNELTVEELDSVNAISSILTDRISMGVLNNESLGQEEVRRMIAQNLGLNRDGDNHLFRGINDFETKENSLMTHLMKYQHQMQGKDVAQGFQNNRSYNGTDKELRAKLGYSAPE